MAKNGSLGLYRDSKKLLGNSISHGCFYFGVHFLPVDPSGCSWLHGAQVSAPSQVYSEEFRGILGQQDSQAEG